MNFVLFMFFAYVVSSVASAMMTKSNPPPARIPEGFWYLHRALMRRVGWGLWPVGVPAALAMLAMKELAFLAWHKLVLLDDFPLDPTPPPMAAPATPAKAPSTPPAPPSTPSTPMTGATSEKTGPDRPAVALGWKPLPTVYLTSGEGSSGPFDDGASS